MKAAGFVVHPGRPAAADAARAIGAWLEERGVRTRTLAGDDAEDETAARAFADGLDLVLWSAATGRSCARHAWHRGRASPCWA